MTNSATTTLRPLPLTSPQGSVWHRVGDSARLELDDITSSRVERVAARVPHPAVVRLVRNAVRRAVARAMVEELEEHLRDLEPEERPEGLVAPLLARALTVPCQAHAAVQAVVPAAVQAVAHAAVQAVAACAEAGTQLGGGQVERGAQVVALTVQAAVQTESTGEPDTVSLTIRVSDFFPRFVPVPRWRTRPASPPLRPDPPTGSVLFQHGPPAWPALRFPLPPLSTPASHVKLPSPPVGRIPLDEIMGLGALSLTPAARPPLHP